MQVPSSNDRNSGPYYGKLKNYINGEWVESKSTQFRDVVNPATGAIIAHVPLSTDEEVEDAVNAAHEAFRAWRETPPVVRARYFFKLDALLEENFENMSRIIVEEMGKTLNEARGEVRRAIEEIECACGMPSLMQGYVHEEVSPGVELKVIMQPLGVFFMVPAFNFPALVPLEYMPYAVAAGNTYITKPSTEVPITQTKIYELIDNVGFPPGVINMIHGSRGVVDKLLENDRVKGVSFVGSTPVGRYIYQKAAQYNKRAQCAAGAKNHFVIMPDAGVDKTVSAMLSSFFGCGGQRCLAGAVAVPVGDIYERLRDKFVESAVKIKVGHGLDPTTQLGPLVSKEHKSSVVGYIEQGLKEGAKMLLDGRKVTIDGYPNDAFLGPTIFDDVSPDMIIANEEIFGPVACIIKAAELDEALEIIEKNRFGHSSMIFTSNGKWAREFEYRTTCGNVGINIGVAATMAFATLGGLKETNFGDLHGRRESVLFFTERKIVVSRWF